MPLFRHTKALPKTWPLVIGRLNGDDGDADDRRVVPLDGVTPRDAASTTKRRDARVDGKYYRKRWSDIHGNGPDVDKASDVTSPVPPSPARRLVLTSQIPCEVPRAIH